MKAYYSQSRNSAHFMEPECPLQSAQQPAAFSYREAEQSNPFLTIPRLVDPF
jgi:hypothetical protein